MAAVLDVVGEQPEHQPLGAGPLSDRPSGLAKSVRYGWSEQVAAEPDDDVARGLDVHGPFDHRHELLAQRHQVGRDVGILVAQRSRVDAGDEEPGCHEVDQTGVADQGDVQVAGAGAVGIEGRAVAASAGR